MNSDVRYTGLKICIITAGFLVPGTSCASLEIRVGFLENVRWTSSLIDGCYNLEAIIARYVLNLR